LGASHLGIEQCDVLIPLPWERVRVRDALAYKNSLIPTLLPREKGSNFPTLVVEGTRERGVNADIYMKIAIPRTLQADNSPAAAPVIEFAH
jgi:hypothetical protein